MVGEFQRRRAGAAFLAIDDDEIGIDFGLQHCLAYGEELPRMADAELETGRLAARELAHFGDELHHLDGRRERRVARWRDAVDTLRYAAGRGDFRADLGAGQDAAVAGLGALAELELDHL